MTRITGSRSMRRIRIIIKRQIRALSRTTPAWLHWLPPYSASLLFHLFLIFIFGLIYWSSGRVGPLPTPSFASQLTQDITSTQPAEQAGDPFTTLETLDPPSLPAEVNPAADRTVAVALESIDFQRELPRPDLESGLADASGVKRRVDGPGMLQVDGVGPSAPFAGRQADARGKIARRKGGTVESERAVELGLDWLARHQNPDGGWSLDFSHRCLPPGCPGLATVVSDTGATGLALLPLLGAGHTHRNPGRYQGSIERGIAWLISNQRADGALDTGGSQHTHMYAHAIATMALAECYGMTQDKRLRDPTQKAIRYIVRAQSPADGGWRYAPMDPGDTSVVGWQLFALRSANLSGLPVSKATLTRVRRFLDRVATNREKTAYCYMPGWPATPPMTAEALVARQLLGWPRDFPPLRKGTSAIAAHLSQTQDRNIYYWYYATQLLHNMGGPDWERWNVKVRDSLVATQRNSENCDRGSWDPTDPDVDRWGRSAGRLFQTSLSILTLEVYYRYLPLYRDGGKGIDESEEMPDEVASELPRESRPQSNPNED